MNKAMPNQARAIDPQAGDGVESLSIEEAAGIRSKLSPLSGSSLTQWVRLDQRERWQKGHKVRVEAYLAALSPEAADEETVLDLIYCEYLLREELGANDSVGEYMRRFPSLASRLERLLTVDQALQTVPPTQRPEVTAAAPIGRETLRMKKSPVLGEVGKYPLLEVFAEGGQAIIYRALHPTLRKEVILKWSKTNLETDSHDHMEREGRLLASMKHPHLGKVLDLDVHEGRPFLVLEYIPGQNLDQHRARVERSIAEWCGLAVKIARAVEAIHAQGVVHLDLKPGNIIIGADGEPRVIDFGLAQFQSAFRHEVMEDGTLVGTLAYMAPEQARGDSTIIGPPADVFALGGILYFLITGKSPYAEIGTIRDLKPFREGNWNRARLDACDAPPRVKELCIRALDRVASRRPSAAAFAEELEAILQPPAPSRPRWPYAAAAAGAIVVASLTWLLWPPASAPTPSPVVPPPVAGPRTRFTKPVVQVWRGDNGPFDLVNAAPLVSGDDFRATTSFPAATHASLFFFSEGRWQKLAAITPEQPPILAYPKQAEKTQTLEGKEGTEFLLVVARASAPVEVDDLNRWLGPWPPLPDLPDQALFTLDEASVNLPLRGSIGASKDRANPVGVVHQRLTELQQRLTAKADHVAGIVFVHREAIE